MTLILLIIAFGLQIIEARYEAKHGDPYHAASIAINFTIFIGLAAILQTSSFWVVLIWVAARLWFDLMFNYFRSNHWSYLGSNFTDRLLKKFEPEFLLAVRFMMSVWLIVFYLGR